MFLFYFFFFKQKTAYEMRISDWSSDVCSSDLGYFWFVGRADDVILSSGYRIGPFETESALFEHPAVAESAVVSSPDPTRGEVVEAFVVLSSGWEPSQDLVKALQEQAKQTPAPYKHTCRHQCVADRPTTADRKNDGD